MSEETFSCGYGAILKCDAEVLEACLAESMVLRQGEQSHPVRVLEIGMHDGGTARGIETFYRERGIQLLYTGIDPDDGTTRPRYTPEGATVIIGDSAEVSAQVADGLDLAISDGCHCFSHVCAEIRLYAPKVRVGGFMLFHDVNPRIQLRTDAGYQYHGDKEDPNNGIAVDKALTEMGWMTTNEGLFGVQGAGVWQFFIEGIPTEPERLDCGMRAYRRVA